MYNYSINLSYPNNNDTTYRRELLECFGMKEYSDDINTKMDELYTQVKPYYVEIIALVKKNSQLAFLDLEDLSYFMLLFAWEYFYDNHLLLVGIHNKSDQIIMLYIINDGY